MKIPKKPPDWDFLFKDKKTINKVMVAVQNEEFSDFLRRVSNLNYKYWDEIKYANPPKCGLNSLQIWFAIKLSRLMKSVTIPLSDKDGALFSFSVLDSWSQIFHEVDQAANGALVNQNEVENSGDQLAISSLMDEAIATSQIEGAVTTRDKARELLRSDRKPINKSEKMVVNSYRTIQMLRDVLNEPLSIDLLNRIQREITTDTLDDPTKAGQFRSESDRIVVASGIEDEIIFSPPPASDLKERVKKLCDFANAGALTDHMGLDFIHPLIKACILHFWLAYEHPYVDGNGRTARALFYWYMLKNNYPLFEYLSISQIIHKAPNKYYRSFLYTEYDTSDLNYSIHFMLHATKLALRDFKEKITKKQKESAVFTQALRNYPGINHRQQELLRHALQNPNHIYTIASHQKSQGIVYETARTDFMDLVSRKLFEQNQSGKKLVFLPSKDLAKKLSEVKRQLKKVEKQ